VKLAVYDEDVTSDDLVGETSYFLDDVVRTGKKAESIGIAYKGRQAGMI
jgi:hypothetical protein